ncbi:MAG: NAD-dependent epimerase/dehydratase family protein [Deltaproteobacteria bacterium]|nr:NAD-dependent epimerase/dehydratase family protein [Deltaproteobacteria bacterium]MCL5277241.1 NAD-dependent epimerase/dehydratase family protein [Deltaproteobacteria bacterium]
MKKVLVTGATGFIGGNLVRESVRRGNSVRAFVLPGDRGGAGLKALGVEVYSGDIRSYGEVKNAVSGMDIVFNCAAVVTDWAPWRLFREVTIGGMENVCKACIEAGVQRLVDISTNDVFGTDESRVMDETFPLRPWHEPYPDAKIEAEKVAWHYYRQYKLPVTMAYPCWAYGAGDKTFVPLLADAIVKRDLMFWRKDVIVWPTYIENLVDLLLLISEDQRAVGNGYLVHDGESVTLQDFCKGIADALGVRPVTTRIPYFAAYAAAVVMEFLWKLLRRKERPLLTTYTVKNLGSRLRFSIEKAERELGWKPKVTFRQGFAKTMEWLKTLDRETLKEK